MSLSIYSPVLRFSSAILFIWVLTFCLKGCAGKLPSVHAGMLGGVKPYLAKKQPTISSVPIEIINRKIFLSASVNGKPYRFIFDTGSPTIISKKAAMDLGLEIKGENIGKDVHGKPVKMGISVLKSMTIGEVGFRNVPVLVFDPSKLPIASCYFDGGIIGSEILPLMNWQIDFSKKRMVLAQDTGVMSDIKGAVVSPLKSFGYPFTPVIEYGAGAKFKDNAVLDTGSPEFIHLNPGAFSELRKLNIFKAPIASAQGSFGESAGGQAESSNYDLAKLRTVSIGGVPFNNVRAWTKTEVPTLVGSRLFESHIVTLDYKKNLFYMKKHGLRFPMSSSYGLKLIPKGTEVVVSFLQTPSIASKAGLREGDRIISFDGIVVRNQLAKDQCGLVSMLADIDDMARVELVVMRDDQKLKAVLQR